MKNLKESNLSIDFKLLKNIQLLGPSFSWGQNEYPHLYVHPCICTHTGFVYQSVCVYMHTHICVLSVCVSIYVCSHNLKFVCCSMVCNSKKSETTETFLRRGLVK